MAYLYDSLVRFGLKPGKDFEFNSESDSLMRVRDAGVRRLVERRYWVHQRGIHISMIPDDQGVVSTALASMATDLKRPGFWRVVLDATGRPVAEHPLTYSTRKFDPEPLDAGNGTDQPPPPQAAGPPIVETTGDLARMLVSWLIGYDRVNDDDIAAILEILSVHADSPREVRLTLPTLSIAQRLHDELLCFEDDANGIPNAAEQSATLRARVFPYTKKFPV